MTNQIMTLDLYWTPGGSLVFDDAARGLIAEPFVMNMDKMLTEAAERTGIDNAATTGFRVRFSAQPFPGAQFKLEWLREECEGNWYWSEDFQEEGWLCPAMFKYFEEAPWELYGEFLPLRLQRMPD